MELKVDSNSTPAQKARAWNALSKRTQDQLTLIIKTFNVKQTELTVKEEK